jgi:HEAT repeat protein
MARRKEFEGRMLAILDPELRHSSPSRRQSATLIGSLALISIVVGAAAPAPRASTNSVASAKEVQSSPIVIEKSHPDSYQVKNTAVITSANGVTLYAQADANADAKADARADAQSTATRAGLLEVMRQRGNRTTGQDDERPALLAKVLATDKDASLRRIAAWGLAEYAHTQVAAEALSNALRHDSDARVREMAAWALADANRSSAATDALSTALRGDGNVQVRVISAWALGSVGDRSAIGALSAALSDASPEVRKRALWAIGDLSPREAPPAIIALLADRDPEVRELAAWSLYQIEDPAAIPALEAALRADKNSKNLQIAYIRALAATGEKSVDALKSLLESPDPEIKSIAVRALAGGNATGPWPWPWPEPRPFPE